MKPRFFVLLLLLCLSAFPLRMSNAGHFDVEVDVAWLRDNARQTSFESADGLETWVDVARENRRLFVAGIQWTF